LPGFAEIGWSATADGNPSSRNWKNIKFAWPVTARASRRWASIFTSLSWSLGNRILINPFKEIWFNTGECINYFLVKENRKPYLEELVWIQTLLLVFCLFWKAEIHFI